MDQFTPDYQDDGLELFFISAKSNLMYEHNESTVNIFKTLGWMMSLWFFWNWLIKFNLIYEKQSK